jgi:hypothetical protein
MGWLYAINPAFAWTLLPFMVFMIIVLPTTWRRSICC